ncbi:hypothetical protein SODALDRAFT_332948 [Sodiomyces alkalinus F11]|uniref:Histone H1 n=1 Tax=Sodiomyces alkalinus (strain CBS 110278 / VKM F-3762 / F11) TaxID=1314773 RepID=A0A3N2PV63_SODAK|nr:hypothetical protein SODALDRAFT_332948 [Sodiomyces alkalinus F11]ROT38380.1 hypothetical protein SODALDRAFT_332948 [Sodiomyces alkalinus F11]
MPPKKIAEEGAPAPAPKKSSHASYQDMITDAIMHLKDRNGSSRQSLKKYVRAQNDIKVTDRMFDSLFNKALKSGVEKGVFEQPKGPSGGTKLAKKTAKPAGAKQATGEKKTTTKKTTTEKKTAPKKATTTTTAKKAAVDKEAKPKKATTAKEKKTTAKKATSTDKPAALSKTKTGRVSKATTAKAGPKKAGPKKASTTKNTAAAAAS